MQSVTMIRFIATLAAEDFVDFGTVASISFYLSSPYAKV